MDNTNNWREKRFVEHSTHNLKAGVNKSRATRSSKKRRRRHAVIGKSIVERMALEQKLGLRGSIPESWDPRSGERKGVQGEVSVPLRPESFFQSQYRNRFMALSCGLRKWKLYHFGDKGNELEPVRGSVVDREQRPSHKRSRP